MTILALEQLMLPRYRILAMGGLFLLQCAIDVSGFD